VKVPEQHDAAELDEISAQVNKDIREGNGARHFERELDELHSLYQRSQTVDPNSETELRRFCGTLRHELDQRVRPRFCCRMVIPDGEGEGFHIQFLDKAGRTFDVAYLFDEAPVIGHEEFVRRVMDEIIQKLFAARERYFARMQ
jgi:hypothetical protein